MGFRIGQGRDIHRFGDGDHVMLGGVRVPHHQGIQAHSDGDVVLHALCDALLGALALGDIGGWFPDTDPEWAGADSSRLLQTVYERVCELGYRLNNLDITVLAQAPRVAPHLAAMREHIAAILELPLDAVSIKATTTEGLGYIGRGEGLAAEAVVLLHDGA
jgi:2-C-methyl-D-erythritol 2,4-cyclodiphosphate synthase